jgi:nucleotidyltransferase AbiEii toxin of type IV toxin-antitoxin system
MDISYPSDEELRQAAVRTGIPVAVLLRDVVRVVEVANLREQGFFGKRSVLAGSMALRNFGSPRFTILDADFSTSTEKAPQDASLKELFAYSDDDLDIIPEGVQPNDQGNTVVKVQPIRFEPVFSNLALDEKDLTFHADVAFRDLVKDGVEIKLKIDHLPGLRIGSDSLEVWAMNPTETMAEKILGWCAHDLVKHYVDVAWIANANDHPDIPVRIDYQELRTVVDAKLETMRTIQRDTYKHLPNLNAVVGKLARAPELDAKQWAALAFLKGRVPDRKEVIKTVQRVATLMRRAQPR